MHVGKFTYPYDTKYRSKIGGVHDTLKRLPNDNADADDQRGTAQKVLDDGPFLLTPTPSCCCCCSTGDGCFDPILHAGSQSKVLRRRLGRSTGRRLCHDPRVLRGR
jgi:hypothetical protein